MVNTELSVKSREKVYSDFDFAFRANPVTGDIALKKDIEAIKQSVINILLTNKGERPFFPTFGSNIRSYLFENFDPVTRTLLENSIQESITNYEPRVKVLNVDVTDLSDRNALNFSVEVEIISPTRITTSIDFVVERLR